jgi:hypothetical protein
VYAFFHDSDSGGPPKLIYVGQNTRPRNRFYEILMVLSKISSLDLSFLNFRRLKEKGQVNFTGLIGEGYTTVLWSKTLLHCLPKESNSLCKN